jgi:hypothetical protein
MRASLSLDRCHVTDVLPGHVYEMVLSVLDRNRGRRGLPLDRCHVTDVLPGVWTSVRDGAVCPGPEEREESPTT